MRVSELSNLKVIDINFKSKLGNINNAKGGKCRRFKLSSGLNKELMYFITGLVTNDEDTNFIIKNYKGKKLSTRSI